MRHMPTVTEMMTAFPLHVEEAVSLDDALHLMNEHRCHHLPVMNNHDVVGLLTLADIELARQPGHSARDIAELTVGDMCQRSVPEVDLHVRLDVVLDMMADDDLDAVLIMRHERLAGILTAQDACRGFAHWLKKEYLPDDDPSVA